MEDEPSGDSEQSSSHSSSESEAAESSGDEYKQPLSSSEANEYEEEDSDANNHNSAKSIEAESDAESVQADVSSEIEPNPMDASFHLTQQEDTISCTSDSVADTDKKDNFESNLSSNDKHNGTDLEKPTEKDPDKTLDYNRSDLSRSMDESFDTKVNKSMVTSGKKSVSQAPSDVVVSPKD